MGCRGPRGRIANRAAHPCRRWRRGDEAQQKGGARRPLNSPTRASEPTASWRSSWRASSPPSLQPSSPCDPFSSLTEFPHSSAGRRGADNWLREGTPVVRAALHLRSHMPPIGLYRFFAVFLVAFFFAAFFAILDPPFPLASLFGSPPRRRAPVPPGPINSGVGLPSPSTARVVRGSTAAGRLAVTKLGGGRCRPPPDLRRAPSASWRPSWPSSSWRRPLQPSSPSVLLEVGPQHLIVTGSQRLG